LLLNSLNKGAKEGNRTAQFQPHTPAGLASTAVVTQQDIDTAAEAFTNDVLKHFDMGILNKPRWLQTTAQISYEGDLWLIIEGMMRHLARALPECKMKINKSRLNSVHTVRCCFLATLITETLNSDDLEMAIQEHIRQRPNLPQDNHWKLENRVVKRSHQNVNTNLEWQPKEQKEVTVEAVHVISTAADKERVTNMMFEVWNPRLPMN
jgi:hypothetical protein